MLPRAPTKYNSTNTNCLLLTISNRQVQVTIQRLSQNHFHYGVAVQTEVSGQFQETHTSHYRYTEATVLFSLASVHMSFCPQPYEVCNYDLSGGDGWQVQCYPKLRFSLRCYRLSAIIQNSQSQHPNQAEWVQHSKPFRFHFVLYVKYIIWICNEYMVPIRPSMHFISELTWHLSP
jgi:hypothetical protein